MDISNIKIWLAVQLIIDFLFLLGIFRYLSGVKNHLEDRILKNASAKIGKNLEPFLADAQRTSVDFERQLKEKRKLIKELNKNLDNKISSLKFYTGNRDL